MKEDRTDLDIPEGTVWPDSDGPVAASAERPADDAAESPIELGPGDQPPVSLDPDRDTAERNAASGGWDGANEQIENDFEAEQLRRSAGERAEDAEDDVPLT